MAAPRIGRPPLRLAAVLPVLLLLGSACTLEPRRDGSAAGTYDATIRRDSHGIPHIVASDFGSLGYGEGYAFAQDHACTLADVVLRARGERARYFGRGEQDTHLASDVVARAFATEEEARRTLDALPPELRAMIAGYAAGYNRYLAETPVERIPGWCRGEHWVRPITVLDLTRRWRLPGLVTEIATAARTGGEEGGGRPKGGGRGEREGGGVRRRVGRSFGTCSRQRASRS